MPEYVVHFTDTEWYEARVEALDREEAQRLVQTYRDTGNALPQVTAWERVDSGMTITEVREVGLRAV